MHRVSVGEIAAAALRGASRVVIIAGSGAAASQAGPEVLALGQLLAAQASETGRRFRQAWGERLIENARYKAKDNKVRKFEGLLEEGRETHRGPLAQIKRGQLAVEF